MIVMRGILILEHLRPMRAAIEGLRDDIRKVNTRLDHLEVQFAGVYAQVAGLHAQYAPLSNPTDRFDQRLERIERRLELVE